LGCLSVETSKPETPCQSRFGTKKDLSLLKDLERLANFYIFQLFTSNGDVSM
jgi:hypothetical protein